MVTDIQVIKDENYKKRKKRNFSQNFFLIFVEIDWQWEMDIGHWASLFMFMSDSVKIKLKYI